MARAPSPSYGRGNFIPNPNHNPNATTCPNTSCNFNPDLIPTPNPRSILFQPYPQTFNHVQPSIQFQTPYPTKFIHLMILQHLHNDYILCHSSSTYKFSKTHESAYYFRNNIVPLFNVLFIYHYLTYSLHSAELNYDPVAAEERINQEALELEKRLSMISQCSLASSTGAFLFAAL